MRPICVTSIGRSGTSLTCGVFAACGALTGPTKPGNSINRKGFFEITELSQRHAKIVKNRPQARYECFDDKPSLDMVKAWIERHGDGETPFVFKTSALFARSFIPLNPLFVTPFRPHKAILQSIKRVKMRPRYSDAEIVEEIKHQQGLATMIRNEVGGFLVYPDELTAGRVSSSGYKTAIEGSGLKWDETAVMRFVDPSLWHFREAS